MKKTQNILVLMTDQQRPDSLGCYGNNIAITPNIDRLAEKGVIFNNCYVQNPVCCPSRYSLCTGRYPHSHRVRANWYAPGKNESSFAHQLGRVGYHTAAIGKMHFTPWYDNFGFDGRIIAESKFHSFCPDDYEHFLNKHGFSRRDLYEKDASYFNNCTAIKSKVPQELHIDSFVGRSTCEYIRHAEEPFCAFVSFPSPHNPYDPPEPYDKLFKDIEMPLRNMSEGEVNRKPREAYDYINNRPEIKQWPTTTDKLTDDMVQKMRAHYYGLNTMIDDWIGKIIEVLKKEGLYDNTIIIYTSDHGDLLGDHGLVFKQCFYEQSVKVPLIFNAPKYFKPHIVNDLVEAIDIFSTLCNLCDTWEGEGRQSKSLLPLLRAENDYKHREAAFSENYFGRMIRYDDYKLVYYPGKSYGEMYNLKDDPYEQQNLWNNTRVQDIKNELLLKLLDWSFKSEDLLPLPVRPDHQDNRPRQYYTTSHGWTEECEVQPWYLNNMLDLYKGWEFSENGLLR